MPFSQHQADKLGRRLRHSDVPSVEDLRLLGAYRDEHLEAMAAAFFGIAKLRFPRLALSARQKNANTIIEKLKYEPKGMALSRMQDVAGVRVIVSGRLEQDDAVDAICGEYQVARVSDRIAEPHAGYRAKHIIVELNGRLVEIQVRTALQNRWAQAFERLGDHWGRQIRRGEQPNDPSHVIRVRGAPVTRGEVVRYMRDDVSVEIEEAEKLHRRVAGLRRRFPALFEAREGDVIPLIREALELEDFARKRLADAAGMIEALRDLKEMVPASVDTESMIHEIGGALHYLVGYRRTTGRLVIAYPCAAEQEVIEKRRELEERHRTDPDFEVVLLSSQSKADLLKTHARYFEGIVELAKYQDPP